MTTQQTPAQPSSGNDQHRSVWTLPTVLTGGAVLIGLALLIPAAVAAAGFSSFWPSVWYAVRAEGIIVMGGMIITSVSRRLRQRLEMPDLHGDEREQTVALKASNFTYIMTTTVLLVIAIVLLLVKTVSIPTDSLLWILLLLQLSNYGSMIYFNRKM